MKTIAIFIFFQFLTFFQAMSSYSQASFSYLVSTPADERIFDGAEDELGNLYLVGLKKYVETNTVSAYLLILNSIGELKYEQEFINEDTLSYFGSIFFTNDSIMIFGAKGSASDAQMDEMWVLILDDDFHVLKNKTYSISGHNIVDFESIINHKGNYVLCGMVDLPQFQNDIFFFETSNTGDSVNFAMISLESMQVEFDLIETESSCYKVFAYGNFPGDQQPPGKIVLFDSLFNYVSADSIPYGLYYNHSAKWLNDSLYIISGNKHMQPQGTDMGIIKLKSNDSFIIGNHFGKIGDTVDYVGACSNLDFISQNEIFFGGASNIIPEQGLFQVEDTWLLLNNLDSNLNLNWQKFYGGDAAYYLWGLKATQDGGCLLMATRYDADIQDHEMDIYILKVDSNGLLTSTGDYPSIPAQQLAIFPNPAREVITFRYPDIFGNDTKEIIIFNSVGNDVKQLSGTQNLNETRTDISDLPVGLYFTVLQVEGEKVATGKFVVVK